jgi:hypothetical protein
MRAVIDLKMEAVRISETSVNFYESAWRNNLEESHLPKYQLAAKKFHLPCLSDTLVVYRKRSFIRISRSLGGPAGYFSFMVVNNVPS